MKHVLVFIHGITLNEQPLTHSESYETLWNRMCEVDASLKEKIDKLIHVEYGHLQPSSKNPRPDERASQAQAISKSLLLKETADQKKKIDTSLTFFMRPLYRKIRDLLMLGFSDAIYYISEEGELAIRSTVYGQVLHELAEFENEDVSLHIIAHSLGCAVSFDFLYGLFAPDSNWHKRQPDFSMHQDHGHSYTNWRNKQKNGSLKLGSYTTIASPIPVILMRKQKLVDKIANGEKLDVSSVGITGSTLKWKVLYDVDDVIAFPSGQIFNNEPAVQDVQVDSGDNLVTSHINYWNEKEVAEECVDLLNRNLC